MTSITGTAGNDVLDGDIGGVPEGDIISGLGGDDVLHGLERADRLDGGAGTDQMFGGHGRDVFVISALADANGLAETFDGGDYTIRDTIDARTAGAGALDLSAATIVGVEGLLLGGQTVTLRADQIAGFSDIRGTAAQDTVVIADGGPGPELSFQQRLLIDVVLGSSGADRIVISDVGSFETHAMRVDGRGGDDVLRAGNGEERLFGGDGNDDLQGGQGADRLDGGEGDDVLLGTGLDGQGAPVADGSDILIGGAGNDRLIGCDSDLLTGGDGDDRYEAAGLGVSTEDYGEAGFDTLLVLANGYVLNAGADVDRIDILALEVTGNELGNTMFGGAAGNLIRGAGGDDTLRGLGGGDTLFGDTGDDWLAGGSGSDVLRGGIGSDRLYSAQASGSGSAAAADWLIGGLGRDRSYGSAGADTYVFNTAAETAAGSANRDAVFNFDALADVIRLAGIDADEGAAGNQAFAFIGGRALTGVAGQLRAGLLGVSTLIQGDTDGDGAADIEIVLVGFTAPLSGDDFVL